MLEKKMALWLNERVNLNMQRLHSYWRMAYVEAPKPRDDSGKSGGNPFAEMAKSRDYAKYHILWKGRSCFIVMNKFPYNCGHLLVLPKREVGDIEKLGPAERREFFDAVIRAKSILARAMKPDGFNIGFNLGSKAGAGIPQHLHCHVVPRWDGDTNFMPVISDTRVLPEAMDELWKRLARFSGILKTPAKKAAKRARGARSKKSGM